MQRIQHRAAKKNISLPSLRLGLVYRIVSGHYVSWQHRLHRHRSWKLDFHLVWWMTCVLRPRNPFRTSIRSNLGFCPCVSHLRHQESWRTAQSIGKPRPELNLLINQLLMKDAECRSQPFRLSSTWACAASEYLIRLIRSAGKLFARWGLVDDWKSEQQKKSVQLIYSDKMWQGCDLQSTSCLPIPMSRPFCLMQESACHAFIWFDSLGKAYLAKQSAPVEAPSPPEPPAPHAPKKTTLRHLGTF